MEHRIAKGISVLALCALTAACAPQTRFAWGDYEEALYAYYKDPAQREIYKKALVAAIDEGRKDNKIAPGLLAELGYLDLEDGNSPEAVSLFREEMALFPESRPFLEGVVQRAQHPAMHAETGAAS